MIEQMVAQLVAVFLGGTSALMLRNADPVYRALLSGDRGHPLDAIGIPVMLLFVGIQGLCLAMSIHGVISPSRDHLLAQLWMLLPERAINAGYAYWRGRWNEAVGSSFAAAQAVRG